MALVRLVSDLKWSYTGMAEETMKGNRSIVSREGSVLLMLFIYLFILSGSEPSRSPKVIFLKVDWGLKTIYNT